MDRLLVALAIALFVVLGVWIWLTAATPLTRATPPILAVGDAFQGSAELPKERIEEVLNQARARVIADNETGNRFCLAALIMSWASFLLTSIIALIAGTHGMALSPAAAPDETALQRLAAASKRWTRAIGFLAAAAAVLTAASGRAEGEATQAYASSDAMQREALLARKGVLDAKDAEEATSVLDGLRAKLSRR